MTDLEWEQADPPGPARGAVVWGHGLTSSRAGDDTSPLAGLAAAATGAGWRWVRYDARGHGRSPKPHDPDAYRWERLAPDMAEVADAAGADRFVAAGASMGAATALWLAVQQPERVAALVLAIPPTAWESRPAQREGYETTASIVEAKGLDRLVSLSRRQPPSTFFGEQGRERSLANLAAMDAGALPHVMRGAAASDLPGPEAISSIDAPALVLAWSDDAGHPVSTAERLAELLPSCERHIATSPEQVATWPELLAGFLDGLDA